MHLQWNRVLQRKTDEQKNAPELPIGRILKSKSLGGNRVILGVSQLKCGTIVWPFTRRREPSDREYRDLEKSFRHSFPNGSLSWCDFRPHFNGFLLNAWCTLAPQADAVATRTNAVELLTRIAVWLQANAHRFNAEDQVQLIVGFDESVKRSGRQIFKCWLPVARLQDLRGLDFDGVGGGFRELEEWPLGVLWRGG